MLLVRTVVLLSVLAYVACVGPGHCCYRIGPIRFLAGWVKDVSLVLLGLVV